MEKYRIKPRFPTARTVLGVEIAETSRGLLHQCQGVEEVVIDEQTSTESAVGLEAV
jgi:hypothetical protein